MSAPAPGRAVIGVRTHQNRWVIRDAEWSCAHAMVTQTGPDSDPVFRILLCEPFEDCRALPVEAHTLDEAIAAVETDAAAHPRPRPTAGA